MKSDYVLQETKTLRFKRFQANYIKYVIKNGYLINNEDFLKLLSESGYKADEINKGRLRRIMNTDIVKQDTDNKLVNFFISSGYDTKELKQLLDDAIKFMRAKQQGQQLFEVYKHLESKHFPESKTKVTQHEQLNTEQELTSISRTITKEVSE